MNRGFALTIGFLAVLAPAMAHAQTNIDQGKPASQLFANACAECHKAPHALAKAEKSAEPADQRSGPVQYVAKMAVSYCG